MTMHVLLTGEIVAHAPIATNPPGSNRGKDKTARLPRMAIWQDKDGARSLRTDIPYFPAAGLRGKLRRVGFNAIRELLQKQTGQSASPFTVADYYLNTIGGVKDKKVADDEKGSGADEPIVDVGYDADLRRKNPLVSLFGAGEPWLTGRLAVSHLIPRLGEIDPTTTFTGIRRDDLHNPDALSALTPEVQAMFLTLSEKRKEMQGLKQIAKDYKNSKEDRSAAKQSMDELQVGGVNRVSVQQPLAGYEALPAGTVFDHSFRLCQASELEVGFFLSVLRSFALDPVIGAHAAHGAGLIGGSWNAMVRTDTATAFDDAGTISFTPYAGLDIQSDALRAALKAWDAASVDLSKFNFFADSKEKKNGKRKGKVKEDHYE